MPKIDFAVLIACVAFGMTGSSLVARSARSAQQSLPGPVTRPASAPSRSKASMEDVVHHRLTLVCVEPEVHSDLTYKPALVPRAFGDSAIGAVNSNACHLRRAAADDVGQVARH